MFIAEKSLLLKKDLDDVYEAGKKAEYDAFWDMYQEKGYRAPYSYAFSGRGWTDETFKPKYDINAAVNSSGIFNYCRITDLIDSLNNSGVSFDCSGATNLQNMFAYASLLKRVPTINVSSSSYSLNMFFYNCETLEYVEKIVICENSLFSSNAFTNCKALTDIIFEGTLATNGLNVQWSPLSHESLMSIINVLKDYSGDTSGTVHTITLGAANLAKLSADEIDIIEQKGWNYG